MREVTAGRDLLSLERGSATQRWSLGQPDTAILRARPIDETTDRASLNRGRS
jgi:hypothetical protein